ncbi:MAG: hypothetical protein HY902_09325 [Deltaproteobacteria bacterium]|nr:hypothetical protein [Deltaproteobacteria bacterium]
MIRTKTETLVRTRTEFDRALRQANLSAEEENVLRMRYGVVAPDDTVLSFRGTDLAGAGQPELAAQLAEMEQRALAMLQNQRVDDGRRASIIARMKRI